MTRTEARAAVAAKLDRLTDEKAVEAYAGLRRQVMADRIAGRPADLPTVRAMTLTGDVVEARIGEDAFDELLDRLDAEAAAEATE